MAKCLEVTVDSIRSETNLSTLKLSQYINQYWCPLYGPVSLHVILFAVQTILCSSKKNHAHQHNEN